MSININTNDSMMTTDNYPISSSPVYTNTINITSQFNIEDILEKYELNYLTVSHKVAEHELLKLKETAPDYASHIKQNLSEKATQEVTKKLTFTKKFDKDLDVHHFNARVWVFTDDELKHLLKEVKDAR